MSTELRPFLFEAYENYGAGKGPTLFQFTVWAHDKGEAGRKAPSIAQHKDGGNWRPTRLAGEADRQTRDALVSVEGV